MLVLAFFAVPLFAERIDVFTQETNAQHAFTADTVEAAMRIAEQFAAKRPKL